MIFRFLTSGESHGKCLNVIIDGIPSGVNIDCGFINGRLARRQAGYGRGGRMKIEKDTAEILSGVRFGKTTGAPICLEIKNKDWENWVIPMSSDAAAAAGENLKLIEDKKIINIRPGHADLPGALKYDTEDVRNILERSSARETAARTAAGAIAECILKEFHIESISFTTQIGTVKAEIPENIFDYKDIIEADDLRTPDRIACEKMKAEIDKAKEEGDTLGGAFRVVFKNVPIGLGSHVQWDRRLDGQIAQAVMSIQAVKSVSIGIGEKAAETKGSMTHDEIFIENDKYFRKTNNAGGIEGGMSNGENIIVSGVMKAIPTMRRALNSVAIDKKIPVQAHFERSDVCAAPACAVTAEAMTAIVLADNLLDKFSHDSLAEMKRNYDAYLKRIAKR